MTIPPILVVGATGKTGRRIASILSGRGFEVRAGSRQAAIPFDWQRRETWDATLDGIEVAYVSYFPDLAAPEAPADITALVESAKTAGLRKLVLLTGRGETNAQACEAIVARSGLVHTLLRASFFSQNFTEGLLLGPVLEGLIAMPAGEVAEPFVDIDDIAEVAVEALTGSRHDGRLYELTGPRVLNFREVAAEISAASGREIAYAPITLAEFHDGIAATVGPDAADLYTGLMAEVFDGRNASVADGVEQALGRPARDFSAFCRAAAASGVWRGPAQ